MSHRRRKRFLVAGLLAATLMVVLISCLSLRWKPHGEGKFPIVALQGHRFPVQALTFSPDGATLISAAYYPGPELDGLEVMCWDVATGQLVTKRLENPGALRYLTLAPGGQRLAATVWDRHVVVCDVTPWRERTRLAIPALYGNTLAFTDDATQLATTDFRDGISVRDVDTGRVCSSWNMQLVSSLAFAPGGALLACAVADGKVWLWDPVSSKEVGALPGHTRSVFALSFSPNGRLLASGDHSSMVKIWDIASMRSQATLKVSDEIYGDEAAALVFSPDGGTLAVAVGRTVQLWDVATGKRLARLEGHQGKVKCLAFSPDGTRLASGSYDQTVRLWDVGQFHVQTPDADKIERPGAEPTDRLDPPAVFPPEASKHPSCLGFPRVQPGSRDLSRISLSSRSPGGKMCVRFRTR
jgi:WD40 repeat protein